MTNSVVNQIVTLGLLLAFVGSAWLIVDVGVGETLDVITNDSGNMTAATVTTFGGDVGFADRIVMIGAWLTTLIGIGALGVSGSNPRVVNQIFKFYPLILGLIGFIEFSDVVGEMIGGSYDFDAVSDGQNALAIFVTGSVITGAASALGMNRRL
ncbi:hypothetical protein N9N26_02080 [Candidatus Poseidoniales archaeon]|nr:hypothetical protein [Candidatus Poseidoniales archaeon]MDB2624242.1 hypothetical protein [Candidatus Poseidoniales archaeon]